MNAQGGYGNGITAMLCVVNLNVLLSIVNNTTTDIRILDKIFQGETN